MANFGASVRDGYGRVLSNPAFTPMMLSGVIDLSGYSAILQTPSPQQISTGIPATKKCAVFFRGTHSSNSNATSNNFCLYRLIDVNGVWFIQFQTRPNPVRLYIFSNQIPFIPEYGIYFYANGEIIYHQNCLPLIVKTYDRRVYPPAVIDKKVAVLPTLLDTEYDDGDVWGGPPLAHRQYFSGAGLIYYGSDVGYHWGARVLSGEWWETTKGFQPILRPFMVNILAYIETDIYDSHYKQSLGLI